MGCGCGGRKVTNIASTAGQANVAGTPAQSGQNTGARLVQSQAFTGGNPVAPVSTQGRITITPRQQV